MGLKVCYVLRRARDKIVEAYHIDFMCEQSFCEVGADESRSPRYHCPAPHTSPLDPLGPHVGPYVLVGATLPARTDADSLPHRKVAVPITALSLRPSVAGHGFLPARR
ncbi:hypothetical protein MPUL_12500 [Mycolicibacterium pulveris]|uniref:Uncharacterized protein n=1 Tax=Mycolicibacterium pulveris TaxID=36813 RepID=A0A7I7UFI6_MYCPV|nr:hypothetical protein MPUL_12500 [Mycolicibacterium pulveris]